MVRVSGRFDGKADDREGQQVGRASKQRKRRKGKMACSHSSRATVQRRVAQCL